MPPSKRVPKNEESMKSRVTIIAALIGLVGTITASLITNFDKLRPANSNVTESKSTLASSQTDAPLNVSNNQLSNEAANLFQPVSSPSQNVTTRANVVPRGESKTNTIPKSNDSKEADSENPAVRRTISISTKGFEFFPTENQPGNKRRGFFGGALRVTILVGGQEFMTEAWKPNGISRVFTFSAVPCRGKSEVITIRVWPTKTPERMVRIDCTSPKIEIDLINEN